MSDRSGISIPVRAGSVATHDFRVGVPTLITGVLFDDRNADNKQQANELALAGQSLEIHVSSSSNLPADVPATWNVQTDTTGHYRASIPLDAHYSISPVARGRRMTTSGPHGFGTASDETERLRNDIGVTRRALVYGSVFYAPPRYDGYLENLWFLFSGPLNGWTVFIDANRNGIADAGELVRRTDDAGQVTFSSVIPGDYLVRAVPPDNTLVPSNRFVAHATLKPGDYHGIRFDFMKTWSISGTIYSDQNFTNRREPGETGIAGVTVFADDNSDNLLEPDETRVVTDADGRYTLNRISSRTETLGVVFPREMYRRPTTADHFVAEPTADGTATVDMGFTQLGEIQGGVFADQNQNGQREDYEYGTLLPWTVWLDLDNDGTPDTDEPTVVQMPQTYQSEFRFEYLQPGTYNVRVIRPAGSKATNYLKNLAVITLHPGEIHTGVNFGVYGVD